MRACFKEIKKHLFLMVIFTRRYLISQIQYRGNFFILLAVESIILLSKLLYVTVIYGTAVVIDGMSPEAILMFTGTFFIVSSVYGSLFLVNFLNFKGMVRSGGLDLYMTKPISLQFMTTLSTIDLAIPIPNFIAGIVLVGGAWHRLGIHASFVNVAGYLVFVAGGIVTVYGILLLPQLFSFWLTNTDAINEVTAELSNFNIMPMLIYKKWMQRVGIFIIPIFVSTNFPVLYILGKLNSIYILWGITVPVIVTILVRLFWSFSIKRYSSANG